MNPVELERPADPTITEYRYLEYLDAHAGRFAACVDVQVYTNGYFGLAVSLYPAGCAGFSVPFGWMVENMVNNWQRELLNRYIVLVLGNTGSELRGKGDLTALFRGGFNKHSLPPA